LDPNVLNAHPIVAAHLSQARIVDSLPRNIPLVLGTIVSQEN
jgi:hypothetical protein